MLTPDERAKAETVMRELRRRQAVIDADPNLSVQGKRAARAREQLEAEATHRRLIEAADARHKQATRAAHRRAFGMTSADVLADRDARQFAAGLTTPGEAAKALAAADLRGDASLARAIAERAWMERGDTDLGGHWSAALDAYAGHDPQRQQDLAELARLDDGGGRAARLSDALYRTLPRPADLQMGSIEALAASAPEGT